MKRKLKIIVTLAVISLSLTADSFAQKMKSPIKTPAVPRVTQVNEITVKPLLKPNGKPLFINFWATWCIPCREEFPDLVEIDKEYRGRIDFITITLDDPAEINRDVTKFLNEMKATMPTYLLYTPNESEVIGSISKEWQGGLPFSVLFGENGETVLFKQGKIKLGLVKEKINSMLSASDNR